VALAALAGVLVAMLPARGTASLLPPLLLLLLLPPPPATCWCRR
jgi:hypothetical protein